MVDVSDQVNPQPQAGADDEEDILLLTEVVEEAPSEIVLEIGPGMEELDSILSKESDSQESPPDKPPEADSDKSLDDLLASLQDLPEELAPPAEEHASPQVPEDPAPVAPFTDTGTEVRQKIATLLSEEQLKAMVREVVQETVERLSRELLPPAAEAAIDREIAELKKRLAQEE